MSGAVLASLGVTAGTWGAELSAWGGAERWVGHDPSESRIGAGTGFFDLPAIVDQLPQLLTTMKLARFAAYLPIDKVKQIGHFLVARKCKDGDCGAGSMTMILDQTSENIWMVMKDNDGGESSTCWTGTAQYQILPGVLQSNFTSD